MTPMPTPVPTHVLDTSAVIAYLNKEVGWEVIAAILANPKKVCAIHSVNLCEVWHRSRVTQDEPAADQIVAGLGAAGIIERSDLDAAFWREVGKHRHAIRSIGGKVPLMDCFAMAIAARCAVPVLTTDRGDFELAQQLGICNVVFIRVSKTQPLSAVEFNAATQS